MGNLGYPRSILNNLIINEVDVEFLEREKTPGLRYGAWVELNDDSDNISLNGEQQYNITVAMGYDEWRGFILHELGHILIKEQKWRKLYFSVLMDREKSLKLDKARRNVEEEIKNSTKNPLHILWRYDSEEVFAESFASKYSPGYKYNTLIVDPDNPAIDLKISEEELKKILEQRKIKIIKIPENALRWGGGQ